MADILIEDEEHENVYRHLRVVIDETREVFVQLLFFYLGTISETYKDFIEKNAHEIYHFCYPEQCCQCQCQSCNNKCPTCICRHIPRVPRKRILHPPQLDIFLDKFGTKMPGHDATYRSARNNCCCRINAALNIGDLDVTLCRLLLVNFTSVVRPGTQERQALDDLVEMRNNFAHMAKTKMSNTEYQTTLKTKKQLLVLARIYGKEQETRDRLDAINREPFNPKVCLDLFNTLLLQAKADQDFKENVNKLTEIVHDLMNLKTEQKLPEFVIKDVENITVIEGDDANFEIWLKEKNIPVKWYKNDDEIVIDSEKISVITKDNIQTLRIHRCREEDKGSYGVKVKDFYRKAKLYVKNYYTRNLKDIRCIEGDNVTLDCEVLYSDMKAEWYKDGFKFENTEKRYTGTEMKRHILKIPCAEMKDSGRYKIDIQNRRRSAEFKVESLFTKHMKNIICIEGETASFVCDVIKDNTTAKWYFDDKEIISSSRIKRETSGRQHKLTIIDTRVSDRGEYTVVVNNCKRKSTLLVKAYFTKSLEEIICTEGESVIFVCEVIEDNTTAKWLFNDKELESSPRIKQETSGRQHKLTIINTVVSDRGEYTVTVNNRKRKVTLLVKDNTYLHDILTKTERRFYIRVMIVGEHGVGKSCLLRRLLGESIDGVESTDGIDIVVRRCKIRLKDGKWILNADKDPKREYAMRIKRARRAENVSNDENKASSTNSQRKHPDPIVHKKDDSLTETGQRESNSSVTVQDYKSGHQPDTFTSEKNPKYASDRELNFDYMEQQPTPLKITKCITFTRKVPTVLTDRVGKEIDQFLLYIEKYEDEGEIYVEIGFWDFAGEKDYYGTHHTFLDPHALYLLVSDCSEGIKQTEPCITYDSIGGYFDFWFDTIHNCTDVKDSTVTEQLDPPIIAVCTGLDKLKREMKKKTDQFRQRLTDAIQDEQKRKHLRDICFVSNIERRDDYFNRVRDLIFEYGSKLKSFGEHVPLKWIRLEQALDVLRESGINIVSRNDVVDLSEKCEFIVQERDREVESFLKHQHKIGSIIYYSDLKDFVILSQQWLADAFKCLVSDKIDNSIKLSDEWKKLEKTGILEMSLMYKLFQKNSELTNEMIQDHIVSVLNKFDIIGINSKEGQHIYYMPYMITSVYTPPLSEIQITFGATNDEWKTPWLCLEFDFLPLSFFTHVMLHFVRNYAMCFDKTLNKHSIYHGVGVFFLDEPPNKLIVLFCKNTIAIQVWHWDHVPEDRYIQILKKMETVVNQLKTKYKARNLKYTVKLKCSNGDINSKSGRINHEDLLKETKDGRYFCDDHSSYHDSTQLFNTWFYKYSDTILSSQFGEPLNKKTDITDTESSDTKIQSSDTDTDCPDPFIEFFVSNPKMCQLCVSNHKPSVYWCKECTKALCMECNVIHRTQPTTSTHTVHFTKPKLSTHNVHRSLSSSSTDKKVLTLGDYNYQIKGLRINEIASLCEGELIISDCNGKHLITCDIKGGNKQFIPLPYIPLGLTVLDINTVALTTANNSKVLIVDVKNKTVTQQIDINKRCYDIVYKNNNLYIGCEDQSLVVLDMSGEVIRTVPLSFRPWSICSGKEGRIYCTAYISDTVYCIDTEGNTIFTVTNPDMSFPTGITCDNEGHFLVVCPESNSIHRISPDGKQCNVIITDITNGGVPSICYDSVSKSIVIGRDDNIYVYTK